jgi:peptide/nickel transport system permease protein
MRGLTIRPIRSRPADVGQGLPEPAKETYAGRASSIAIRVSSRLALAAITVVCVTFGTFCLLYGIGNPAGAIAGQDATASQIAAVKLQFGLNRPIPVQYASWLTGVVHGNFGTSYQSGGPVAGLLVQAFPETLSLVIGAMLISIPFSLVAGFVAASRPGSLIDKATRGVALVGIAVPPIVLGLLVSLVFAVKVKLLPAAGYVPLSGGIGSWLSHLILPWITLAAALTAQQVRTLRASVAQELRADYVRTARAKGVSERVILVKHVGRNSLLPLLAVIGLQVPRLITGTVLVEYVFGIQGVGNLIVSAVLNEDYPVVQALVLIVALTILVSNFIVDSLYGYVSPVTRMAR